MKCQSCQEAEATHTLCKVSKLDGREVARRAACNRCGLLAIHQYTGGPDVWRLFQGVPAAPMAMDRTEYGLDEVTHVPGQMVMAL
jgi:protein-arginine kinase activator protein McsA